MVVKIGRMEIKLKPIAFVKNSRKEMTDDFWGNVISEIELGEDLPEHAFDNIEAFSHLEIIFYFSKVEKTVFSGRPRGNPAYPEMGIFAQRKKDRPNQLGLTTVSLLGHDGRSIKVRGLDAINGTPVLDIKPVFREFAPKGEIRQATWVADLMKDYWK
jgi:tRNA-Thr(GGU) m(6)t(6)A37 methyltransferase TsaA